MSVKWACFDEILLREFYLVLGIYNKIVQFGKYLYVKENIIKTIWLIGICIQLLLIDTDQITSWLPTDC